MNPVKLATHPSRLSIAVISADCISFENYQAHAIPNVMDRYWMAVVMEFDAPTVLFVKTNDHAVELDLQHTYSSLIHTLLIGKTVDLEAQDKQQLLANGAFHYYATNSRSPDVSFKGMLEVPGIPDGLEHFGMGGETTPEMSTCAVFLHKKTF